MSFVNLPSLVSRLSSLVLFVTVLSNAYTLADAERAYVSRDFATANAAYSAVCPTLPAAEQVSCVYWHTLSLSQTGKASDFKAAGKKLDSLIAKVSPQDSLYSDLVMTRAQFEMYLKKYGKARESLRHAAETSRNPNSSTLQQVCAMLMKVDKAKETEELCSAMKDGSLVAVLAADSAVQDSDKVDSAKAVPVKMDSVKVDSVKAPVVADTVKKDSLKQDSVKADSAKAEPAVVDAPETYSLQVGAFSKRENAEMLVAALKSRSIETRIVERISTDRVLYLVQTMPFASRAEAVEFGEKTFVPLKMEYNPVKNP